MIPEISFIQLLITFLTFFIIYVVFTLYIKPFYQVLYYKHQGIPIFFNWRLIPIFGFWKDAQEKGDYFYKYKSLLRKEPQTKAIAENFLGRAIVKVTDPELIKEFLQRYDVYQKDTTFIHLLHDLANGTVIEMEGADWKKRRKMLSGAFSFEFLKNTIPTIIEVTQSQFAQWIQRGELTEQNLVEKMSLITGEIVGRFMFGRRFEYQAINGVPITIALQRLLVDIMEEVISLPNVLFGAKAVHANILPRHKKLNADIANMRATCLKMIEEENRSSDETEKNLIKLMLDLRSGKSGEERLSDEEITGEFVGFFTAGTDTSSHLIASSIYFLWKDPRIFEEVRKEVDREFSDLTKITVDSLNRMDYTAAVLKETLRLGGPAAILFDRVATRDDNLCGLKIKKGTLVNLTMDILFTSEKYFSRPKEFIPERWLNTPEFAKDGFKKEAYAYLPFSAGPKNCLGQHLVMIESKIILALLIKTFDFSFDENYKFVLAMKFVYEGIDPLMINLKPKRTNE